MARHHIALFLGALLFLTACEKFRDNGDGSRCNFDGCEGSGSLTNGEESNSFSCSATPAKSIIQILGDEASIAVHVRVLGGTAPYSLAANTVEDGEYAGISSFGGQTTIIPTFTSTGSKNGNVTITDADGQVTSCGYTVSVKEDLTLACDLILDNSSPSINTKVKFNFQVNGPNGKYLFKFYPVAGEATHFQLLKNLTDSVHEASYEYAYGTKGLKNPELRIKNLDTQEVAHCSVDGGLKVRDPKMTVSVDPSTTVPIGTEMKLEAKVSDFAGTPTFTFSADSNSITIVQNGKYATLTSSSSSYLQSNITVVAKDSTNEEITVEGPVTFAPTTGCSLTKVTSGDPLVNTEIQFQFAANNGAAVKVTDYELSSGCSLLSGESSDVRVKCTTAGDKTIKVAGETTGTKAICNAGDWLSSTAKVLPELGCDISTSPNPSPTTAPVVLKIHPTGLSSSSNIEVLEFQASAQAEMIIDHDNGLEKQIQFFRPGNWLLRAKIKDKANDRIATCETQHRAEIYAAACRARFVQDGSFITSARKEDNIRLHVESNIPWGDISISPGAAVLSSPSPGQAIIFPVTANNIVYNTTGSVTAHANIRNPINGIVSSCPAPITLTSEAACTMNGPSHVVLERTAVRGNSVSDVGPQVVAYNVNFANVKLPIDLVQASGSGQNVSLLGQNTTAYTANIDFKYSGVYTPSVTHTDKFDKYADSCSPGAVNVDKVTNTYISGAYNYYGTVKVCNNSAVAQSVLVETNAKHYHSGTPNRTFSINPGSCVKESFYKPADDYSFRATFKTFHNLNQTKTGLVGTVCRGYNTDNCGYSFNDL